MKQKRLWEICPECGKEDHKPEHRYCTGCSAPIYNECNNEQCGEPVDYEDCYCGFCGKPTTRLALYPED